MHICRLDVWVGTLNPVPPAIHIALGQLHQEQVYQTSDIWHGVARLQRLSNPVLSHPPVVLHSGPAGRLGSVLQVGMELFQPLPHGRRVPLLLLLTLRWRSPGLQIDQPTLRRQPSICIGAVSERESRGVPFSIGSGVLGVQALAFGADSTEGAPGSSLASHGGCLSSLTGARKASRIFPVSGYIHCHSWPLLATS